MAPDVALSMDGCRLEPQDARLEQANYLALDSSYEVGLSALQVLAARAVLRQRGRRR